MKVYADTSALVAWFHPADSFAETVTEWCRDVSPDFFWNSILRAELRHGLRKISGPYGALAWHAYRASESSKKLRLHTQPVSALFEWADKYVFKEPGEREYHSLRDLPRRAAEKARAGRIHHDFVFRAG